MATYTRLLIGNRIEIAQPGRVGSAHLIYKWWDMQQPQNSPGDRTHRSHYEIIRNKLRDLVEEAKRRPCPYTPQADIELARGPTYPTPWYGEGF